MFLAFKFGDLHRETYLQIFLVMQPECRFVSEGKGSPKPSQATASLGIVLRVHLGQGQTVESQSLGRYV